MLQRFEQAVKKNDPPRDILEVTRLLGGAIKNGAQSWPGMKTQVPALAAVNPDEIPEEGLQLITDSEEAHVDS